MQTVRTTVTLPQNVYDSLRELSFEQRRSYGDIFAEIFLKYGAKVTPQKKSAAEIMALFEEVGRSGEKIDLLEALREDRDR